MTKKFPGGFITKSPTAPSSSAATGIWTLEQAAQYKQASAWPTAPAPEPSPGGLWVWGDNFYASLGQNNRINKSSPVQLGSATDWKQAYVAGINAGSLAIKSNGTLWAWGKNTSGQLGLNDTYNRSSPVQVGALTNWSKVVGSASNWSSTFALKTDGTIWSWGYNYGGFLGHNTAASAKKSSPVQIGSLTTWADIAFGSAIKTDGTLWIWGSAGLGRLGNNTSSGNVSSPIQVGALTNWSKITNVYAPLAVKTDGSLWTWGSNGGGQLGQNDTARRSSPVQIGALTNWQANSNKFTAIDYFQFAAAVKTDGTLWTWGKNQTGSLGLGDVVYRSSPTQVGALTTWQMASCVWSSFGIKT